MTSEAPRQPGFLFATSVGVGAIVGGGILALAGVAFASTGPSAILAFALNGVIALLTALSFAEMASRFPESGGTYTYARKMLSVETAFAVGWVVWFASISAAVLYALGFSHFLLVMLESALGLELARPVRSGVAVLSVLATGWLLARGLAGGGKWINVAKVAVFAVLIAGGLVALARQPRIDTAAALSPFFESGFAGLIQAMGYTFIALQGFDLIAAVAGEIRQPERNVPRAMLASLVIALAVYLPLLLVVAGVGVDPHTGVAAAAASDPEGLVVTAAGRFLGPVGSWLVIVAAILAMYSALQANLFAASRIAATMARDRTLPSRLSRVNRQGNPGMSLAATTVLVSLIIVALPDVSAAGAASSLIFLATFAIAHGLSVLVRRRSVLVAPPFRTPFFPLVPLVGGLSCLGLAVFQGIAVPSAGAIAVMWLAAGSLLFLLLFARRARIRDATDAAHNPELLALRGRSPLVLVPIANPQNAEALISLAGSLVPSGMGRVMMQHVVVSDGKWDGARQMEAVESGQSVWKSLLVLSSQLGVQAETLTSLASEPAGEIARVARLHRCRWLVMGFSELPDDEGPSRTDELLNSVDADVVVLRARPGWNFPQAARILVPSAGRGFHDYLLGRVIGSLLRDRPREITCLRVLPANARGPEIEREQQLLQRRAADLIWHDARTIVDCDDDPAACIARRAAECDLIVLGAQGRRGRVFGAVTRKIAASTDCPLVVISSRS